MSVFYHPFSYVSTTTTVDLVSIAPTFGTNFNSKCILGFTQLRFTGGEGT